MIGGGTRVTEGVRPGRMCVACVCCAMSQTNGATPLFIAGQKGHLECVMALLEKGAAINQAMVGCSRCMALQCEGYSRGDPWGLRACMCSWWGGCPPRGGPAHGPLPRRSGEHIDDQVRHACDRGGLAWHDVWLVCAARCCRRTGPRLCLSPARREKWSACGRCWAEALRSTRRRWVVQARWLGTVGAIPAGIRGSLAACMCSWWGCCPPRCGGVCARGDPAHVTGGEHLDDRVRRTRGRDGVGAARCVACTPRGVAEHWGHAAVHRL